jgi:phosphoribosylformimino-5-aminoimidazole carboxamide ribotide isomerase
MEARQHVGFAVIPAIDLRAGRVVRLVEGDYARETSYGDDPVSVARAFVSAGARWIHLVDLDGAKGEPRQAATVERIVQAVGEAASCEVGGGLRSADAVDEMLRTGAARVVLGTALLRDPTLARVLVTRHGPEAIVAALDVRDGLALGDGWVAGAMARDADGALNALADAGVARFVVTAIVRDGALGGPDVELLRRFVETGRGAIVASGGIASLADLEAVRDVGCEGAIVGRAIYEGVIDLATAIRTVDSQAPM